MNTKAIIDRVQDIIDAHTSMTETTIGCRTEEVRVIWDPAALFDDIKQVIEAALNPEEGDIWPPKSTDSENI